MKNHNRWIILATIFLFIFIISVICIIDKSTTPDPLISRRTEDDILEITIPKKNTTGVLTIKDIDGDIFYQYKGTIHIVNDGKNGEEIKIEINLPTHSGE